MWDKIDEKNSKEKENESNLEETQLGFVYHLYFIPYIVLEQKWNLAQEVKGICVRGGVRPVTPRQRTANRSTGCPCVTLNCSPRFEGPSARYRRCVKDVIATV